MQYIRIVASLSAIIILHLDMKEFKAKRYIISYNVAEFV